MSEREIDWTKYGDVVLAAVGTTHTYGDHTGMWCVDDAHDKRLGSGKTLEATQAKARRHPRVVEWEAKHRFPEIDVTREIYLALKTVLSRASHKIECMTVNPSEDWGEKGSVSFSNCRCGIARADAALRLYEEKVQAVSNDKLSAMSPRPRAFSCPAHGSSNVVQASEAFAHMDAQDKRIAELEREIREARELLCQVNDFVVNIWNIETLTIYRIRDFIRRNAERENGNE